MQTIQTRLWFLEGSCLALGLFASGLLLLASLDVVAQEASVEAQAAEIDALEPAVSTEQLTEATAASPEPSADEETAPAVVLAADIRRRENATGVMDEIDLGRTEITGNQQLPTVMYIVPWKKSDPGDLLGKPVNSLLDEVLAPIDRTEFIRQVDYYDDLYGEEEAE